MKIWRRFRWSLRTLILLALAAGATGVFVLRIWDPPWIIATRIEDSSRRIDKIVLSLDNTKFALSCSDRTVRIVDARTSAVESILSMKAPRKMAFSPNGTLLATVIDGEGVSLWELKSGERIRHSEGKEGLARSCLFSPSGARLFVGDLGGATRVFDVATFQILETFGERHWFRSRTLSQDGRLILTWGHSGNSAILEARDAETGELVLNLISDDDSIEFASFCGGGRYVVTHGLDKVAKLRRSSDGQCVRVFSGHTGLIRSCDVSPSGDLFVTGSEDETARIWSVETGECLHVLPCGSTGVPEIPDDVTTTQFSPDGTRIVTMGWIHDARIWDAGSGRLAFDLKAAYGSEAEKIFFDADGALWLLKRDHKQLLKLVRTRSEFWWGAAAIPAFWLSAFLWAAVIWSLRRDWKVLGMLQPAGEAPKEG